jgi:glucose-1-phosphate thymidylyltransferase
MKVIIPLAGKGTRLRPHTHVTPKPMLKIAGKPVMAYILEDLKRLGGVEQIVYITGHLKEKVEEYARTAFDFDSVFVEQKVQDGTAGAVNLARPYVDQPVLIIFVDTIFDADLSIIQTTDADGIIWTKEVEDYQRFGVVVTDENGFMRKIVEKPSTPVSKRANIGLYYVRNWKLMFEGIDWTLKQPKNKGEYYLTDAFQYMIDQGARIKVVDVEGWYDAGKLETLLETNRVILDKGGVTVRTSTIGPNVSLGKGTVVQGSQLRDTIVGDEARITDSTLEKSMVGDGAVVEGVRGEITIADHSEIRAKAPDAVTANPS